jgi:inner membrane protein
MDSLTQLTLGAAVGEAVLGKKVGNRAMLWGAIGGTVPDLDVFANMAADEISALAFHRAITHSFVFAGIAPLILGWLIHRVYKREKVGASMGLAAISLLALVGLGSLGMPIPLWEVTKTAATVTAAIVFFPLLAWGVRSLRGKPAYEEATHWEWTKLFFWAIFTHPLLDACTTYGTQLFQPFLDYRVAFNNISVADPAYTLPFLLLLLAALIAGRKRQRLRTALNIAGLTVSSLYLVWTFYNKYQVHQVFRQSLDREEIVYHRFMTAPTILNNLLWQGIAEGDTAYYHGMYSILDKEAKVQSFTVIPKKHDLLPPEPHSRDLEVLKWFSDGYFSIMERDSGSLQYNDLRFGSLNQSFDDPSDFVFHFILEQDETGQLRARQSREQPRDADKAFKRLWERMMGE